MTERTDRELTELAAKAAGIDHPGGEHSRYNDGRLWDCNGLRWWNPLEDDGDALRLAVKLGITLIAYPIYGNDKHSAVGQKKMPLGTEPEELWSIVAYNAAPEAATRRAIVECAAAMAEGGEHD